MMTSCQYCYEFAVGSFQFRRNVAVGNDGYFNWECCKTGPAANPFVQDTTFKITVYPQIVLSSIAVFSCLIVIVGLLLPLFSEQSQQRIQQTNSSRRNRGRNEQNYSTYNLYLVYLAFPDFILNIYLLGMYGSYANQKFNENFYMIVVSTLFDADNMSILKAHEGSLIVACSTANIFRNAVVSYEVFILLRNCHETKINNPPSLKKVSLQAMVVYAFAICVFGISFYTGDVDNVATWCFFLVIYILPIGFVVCITVTISLRGFMPSATGKMKELAWYFFRIVVVFCFIWIPAFILLFLGQFNNDLFYRVYVVFFLVCAIESILSNCMVLTKSDVRKYVFDLITLSCIRSTNSQQDNQY